MGFADIESDSADKLQIAAIRARSPRFVSEFEADIRRLYLRMMDEPVPARLLGILRAGLSSGKS